MKHITTEDSKKWMTMALAEAQKGLGKVAPNPMVGAVVVKNNKLIGKGHHEFFGGPHAEVNAINSCSESVEGSTIYCTLEPCCHLKKKTPPCTQFLIKNKIKEVIVASLDPNPLVAGKGMKQLQANGIEVALGPFEKQAIKLNEVFFKFIKTKLPFVHAKWAQSLDGKLATTSYHSKWISNEESRKYAHQLRGHYQAILIGRNTLEQDNPQLNIRFGLERLYKAPTPIIVGDVNKMNYDSYLLTNSINHQAIIITPTIPTEKSQQNISRLNICTIYIPSQNNMILPQKILEELGKRQISSVLIEGGPQLHEQFFEAKCVDKLTTFIAPKLVGKGHAPIQKIEIKTINESIQFNDIDISINENKDIIWHGYPSY